MSDIEAIWAQMNSLSKPLDALAADAQRMVKSGDRLAAGLAIGALMRQSQILYDVSLTLPNTPPEPARP